MAEYEHVSNNHTLALPVFTGIVVPSSTCCRVSCNLHHTKTHTLSYILISIFIYKYTYCRFAGTHLFNFQDYYSSLTNIRSLLASQRTVAQLSECQSLLITARTAATALQALAEVEGDYVTIQQAQARFDHDLTPLQAEISRGTTTMNVTANGNTAEQDFFYRNNDLEQQGLLDTEALMQSSHDLLRESQA